MKLLRICLLWLSLGLPTASLAFELSPKAQISLITGSPGADMYALFGHSGIRIYDPFFGLDVMYNYGTFDFNTPNFYLKFAQGRLLYSLSKDNYQHFLYFYQIEGRSVEEQVLNLSKEDKQKLFAFLENNAKPENRLYKYDFFYDNCASRIRDVFDKVFGKRLTWKLEEKTPSKTFKQLVTPYLKDNWVHFGIYLILGLRSDYRATPAQKMFLPDYLADAIGEASLATDGKTAPLAQPKRVALQMMTSQPANGIFSPVLLTTLLALGLGGLAYWEHKKGTRLRGVDFALFFLMGLVGCFFLLMWFATDHLATHINLNMLWAFPAHLVMAFWTLRRDVGKVGRAYFKGIAILQGLLVLGWFFLPQQLPLAALPLVLLLGVRAWQASLSK